MKHFGVVALALAILAAAAVQFAADGAFGKAAAATSLPQTIAKLVGDGPARALGIEPAGSSADALSIGAEVERLDAADDYRGARDLQAALAARLETRHANREVLADALWRLGRLDAEVGYREPPHRRLEWEKALQDYRAALELVPLSVTTLLAAGNQALLVGDRKAAAEYFRRALASDPSSAAAREGLQRLQSGEYPPPFVAPAEWKGPASK